MTRTSLGFLCRFWLAELLPALAVALVAGAALLVRLPGSSVAFFAVAVMGFRALDRLVVGEWRPRLWPWRLSRRIVGFRAASDERVTLLFPAGLNEVVETPEVMRWSASDLDDLAQRFGFRLRRRLTVVLVPSHEDLTADFGQPMGGTALISATAVVLAADCPVREGLRHELAHLFASRWNMYPPPLLEEGLAVWLQRAEQQRTDTAEVVGLVRRFGTDPSPLLDRRYFFAEHRLHDCYALAGAFTGFLISRFGWDRYQRFYRKADRWTLRSVFKRHYGMSLEDAWRRCHDESVAMASLDRRRREDQLFNLIL
jgi:hypothetical protein